MITIALAVVWVLLAGGLGMLMRRGAEAAKTGKDTGGFEQGADADKKDDADDTSLGSLKSDDASETKADAKPKAEDVVPSDSKSPADADAAKSDAATPEPTTPDAEETDTSEPEKTTPVEKTDAPVEAEPAKEVPSAPETPGVEAPATEPNP